MSAITLRPSDAVDIAGELPQLFKLATALKQAGGFLPRHIRNEGELVAVILAGRELGLPPMTSLRSIHLVEGRVTLAADTQLALMARAGVTYQWTADGRSGTAQLRLQRPGMQPHVQTYTLDDAKQAGLAGKDNWRKHTAAMLRARCVSGAAKAYAPDILAGVYTPDEAEEFTPQQAATENHLSGQRERAIDDAQDAEFEAVEPTKRDEYGIAIPASPCPVVTKDGPNKGKPWSELKGPLLEKMYADAGRMTAVQVEWCEYLLARRQARKAKEARDAEAKAAQEAQYKDAHDTSSEGGSWVAGDAGDTEPPADVKLPGSEEAAQ